MIVFSAVMLSIFLFMYLFINHYVLDAYEQAMVANSRQLNTKISEQVDLYFNDLNRLSRNSVSNQNLMGDMRNLDRLTHELTQYETLFFGRSFESYSSYLLNFSDLNASNVYIYGRQNRFKFAYGSLRLESNFEKIYQDPKMPSLFPGKAVLFFENENTDPAAKKPSISVIQAFSEISGYITGYIELQQDYTRLRKITDLGDSGVVYILDKDGRTLYPAEKLDSDALSVIQQAIHAGSRGLAKGDFFYTAQRSNESGFTTVVKHSSRAVFKPLYTLQNTTLLLIAAVCLLAIVIIYLLTKSMIEPIRKLRSRILKVDFDNFSLFTNSISPNNEVNLLNDAFQHMMERLRLSMERELIAGKEEVKARFTALQAQIAPHFIHNILYLISNAAEEERNDDVTAMCKNLSDMLRYLTESPYRDVTIEQEMEYTSSYLSLIAYKYEAFLDYRIEVHDGARNMIVPRLTLQPFVENAVKHAFNDGDPPWIIRISCHMDGDEWEAEIRDNGSGMTADQFQSIRAAIDNILASDKADYNETTGIGGMGMANTVMRLKTLYPESLRVELDNNGAGEDGLRIRIRASIYPTI
jgi:two-component system sensor histidine kinase YesM